MQEALDDDDPFADLRWPTGRNAESRRVMFVRRPTVCRQIVIVVVDRFCNVVDY